MHPFRTLRMPSPALVVAAIALCLAVAGSALAGADTANRAFSKAKVGKIAKKKANAVVNQRESCLNVNSAKTAGTADSATNAVNAERVGGVALSAIDYSAGVAGATTPIFNGSGLTLQAECAASTEIKIAATTSKPDVDRRLTIDEIADSGLVTFEYDAKDGASVSGTLSIDEMQAAGSPPSCEVHGHLMASGVA